ncbi:phosphatase PAP2 family protein [Wohlfahrtiimonas larvae]|uniref:undecaprenyl-diphosphate phosphatase n=1 Tax=Wohlfahrtiimonas larvae TaxID=1157986 RepID=A0ABP9MG15_9GAMM|nr:phosphatase PAP2 family protein [Wohlfahrtiimonas larvae]
MIILSRQKTIIILLAILQLTLIPIVLWLADWQWSLDNTFNGLDQFLFWVTQSGTAIVYAFLTCVFLLIILSLFAWHKTHWVIIAMTAFILLISTQVVKTALKSFYKEPRPYTSYLVEQGVDLDKFYQEIRSVRSEIVKNSVQSQVNMPDYLKKHWEKEVGYSFPSGHVAFAVTWLMIFILILPMNRKRDWAIVFVIFIWTILMIVSRIRFGMHYPIDVFVSTLYVPIICLIYAKLTQCSRLEPYFDRLQNLHDQILSYIIRR